MPAIGREITRGLKEAERGLAVGAAVQTFTWPAVNGKEIPCVPTGLGRQVIIDREGNEVEIDLRLFVRREHFLTADSGLITVDSELYTVDDDTPTPVSGRECVFRGVTYRIITATESGPKSHFELTLKDAASNG